MNAMTWLVLLCGAWLAVQGEGLKPAPATAEPAVNLEKGFLRPPESARPWSYWFWMNQKITREGITADMEAMKRIGVGGLLLMDVNYRIPDGPVAFMTPEWRALFKHALAEADRLGLQIAMNNDAGWTGSGGPWIKPDQAMKRLVWSETRISGPHAVSAGLPQPPAALDYYRDSAVLAFPAPAGEELRMADARPKITSNVPAFAGDKLADRNAGTYVALPFAKGEAPPYIQFEFGAPFRAQTLFLAHGPRAAHNRVQQGELQVSDDGKTFRTVRRFNVAWSSVSIPFDETAARFYRILLSGAQPGAKALHVAEAELSGALRVQSWEGKSGATFINEHGGGAQVLAADASPATSGAPSAAVRPETVLDLTDKMDQQGVLKWAAPPGSWVVLRLGYTLTGAQNKPSTAAGQGLEPDKFDARGIEAAFAGLMAKLLQEAGPLKGKALALSHIDSWENGAQTWTPALREEFKKRRGYDLLPWLPVMAGGRVVGTPERSERFLWDLRRTYADLIAENYLGRMARLCHEQGIGFQAEASGRQQYLYDPITFQSQSDLPMGEFWIGGGPRVDCKVAASTAHLYNRPVAGAEAYTSGKGAWQDDPFSLKALGDRAFCLGINRYFLCCGNLQPWLKHKPGMTTGPWGMNFDRTQTWWEPGAAWVSYITRCQYLLQQGCFVADALYLVGEGAPAYLGWRSELSVPLPEGYDYDGCDANAVLNLLSVRDGRLVTPGGMSYRMLILPESDAMTPALARRLRELVRDGALVVGPPPARSPGLENAPSCDEEVRGIAREVWNGCDGVTQKENGFGQGQVMWGKTFPEIADALKLAPDFSSKVDGGKAGPLFIHRRTQEADIYFLSNQENGPVEALCSFRVADRVPEVWHADSGEMTQAGVYQVKEGRTFVPLRFDPAGSVFVIFRHAPVRPPVVALCRNGEALISAAPDTERSAAADAKQDPDRLPLRERYPETRSDFTLAAWVRPAKGIVLPAEKEAGIELLKNQQVLIAAENGCFAFGDGHATAGLSVGTNGLCVMEAASRYRPFRIVVEQPVTGWTHLVLVYRKNAPSLYLNGKPVRSARASRYVVHPGALAARAPLSFAGEMKEVRLLARALTDAEVAGLPADKPQSVAAGRPTLQTVGGRLTATVQEGGRYTLDLADGGKKTFAVASVLSPLEVAGPWEVRFPAGWGAPEKVVFDGLTPWNEHGLPGVRYFSGTATYRKIFDLPTEVSGNVTQNDQPVTCNRLFLDLGQVKNLAEVSLNGKRLGVLWKPPFALDITQAARPGANQLELRITNLWPNRLIGDEQEPGDIEWCEEGNMKQWPQWFVEGSPRPSKGRYTFTTWRHYTKESPLLESGLLGPVRLVPAVQITVP